MLRITSRFFFRRNKIMDLNYLLEKKAIMKEGF